MRRLRRGRLLPNLLSCRPVERPSPRSGARAGPLRVPSGRVPSCPSRLFFAGASADGWGLVAAGFPVSTAVVKKMRSFPDHGRGVAFSRDLGFPQHILRPAELRRSSGPRDAIVVRSAPARPFPVDDRLGQQGQSKAQSHTRQQVVSNHPQSPHSQPGLMSEPEARASASGCLSTDARVLELVTLGGNPSDQRNSKNIMFKTRPAPGHYHSPRSSSPIARRPRRRPGPVRDTLRRLPRRRWQGRRPRSGCRYVPSLVPTASCRSAPPKEVRTLILEGLPSQGMPPIAVPEPPAHPARRLLPLTHRPCVQYPSRRG